MCPSQQPIVTSADGLEPYLLVADPTGEIFDNLPLGMGVRLDEHGVVSALSTTLSPARTAYHLVGRPFLRGILPRSDIGLLEHRYRTGVEEGLASIAFWARFVMIDRSPLVTVALFYSRQLGAGWAFVREGRS